MEKQNVPLSRLWITKDELVEVKKVLETGWLTKGPKNQELEEMVSNYLGVKHAICVSSCTTALHLAILSLGIEDGEILVADYTYPATGHSVKYCGLTPVFVDVDPKTYNMDYKVMKKKINKKRTKAIIVVHTFGQSADMEKIMKVANKKNIPVIEDAACALGSKFKGQYCGTFGKIGCFSMHATKGVSCFPKGSRVNIIPEKRGKKGESSVSTKFIEDIKIGDKVLTFNEKTSEKEYKSVLNIFERNVNEKLIFIKLSNGNQFTVTKNHPIFSNGSWIRADELVLGQELLQYKYRELQARIIGKNQKGKTYEEMYGKEESKKRKSKISKKIKENLVDPNYGYWFRDTRMMNEVNKRVHTGRTPDKKTREKMSISGLERWGNMTEEEMKEVSKKMIQVMSNDEIRRKISKSINYLLENDVSYRKSISIGVKKAQEKESYWINYSKGLNLKPNKLEKKLNEIIQDIIPGEFEFNGDYRLGVIVDRMIPDFVNVNGKKKVIDLFGDYWHEKQEEQERIDRMKKKGWECLVIWEHELKNIENVKNKIKTYLFNPNVELVKITEIKEVDYSGKVYNLQVQDNSNYFVYGILVHNCGEGGILVTNDDMIAEKVRSLSTFGIDRWAKEKNKDFDIPVFAEIGFNYKMSDLAAAVGIAQFKKLDKIIKKKNALARYWNKRLKEIDYINQPYIRKGKGNVHNYQGYCCLVTPVVNRNKLIQLLKDRGIQTQIGTYSSFIQPCYNYEGDQCHTSLDIYNRAIRLPLFYKLKKSEIDYVIDVLKEIRNEVFI